MDPEPSSFLVLLDILKPLDPSLVFPLILLFILLLASALVSGSEVAYFSLSARQLDQMEQEKRGGLDTLKDLLDHPKTLLATILIANNFVNVGIVILSSFLSFELFDFTDYPTLGFLVQVVAITFLILLFGEVLPKVYATKNPTGFGLFMANPMILLRRIFPTRSRFAPGKRQTATVFQLQQLPFWPRFTVMRRWSATQRHTRSTGLRATRAMARRDTVKRLRTMA